MPKIVNCPTCDRRVRWEPASIWRPFCSDRCRLIDLGDWLDESHRISDPLHDGAEGCDEAEFEIGPDSERAFDEAADQEFGVHPEPLRSSGGPSKH
jgi:endogenous inhibitor of DNA gyrase (YacG/DUF329 family)